MRHVVSLAVLVGTVLIATPATAAKWEYVGSAGADAETVTWAVDRESIRPTGNTRRVWVQTQRIAPNANESYVSEKMYFKINCSEWMMATLTFISYTESGTVISSLSTQEPDSSVRLSPIVPESMGEAVAESVCK